MLRLQFKKTLHDWELENQSHVQKPMLTEALEAASKHGDLDLVCFLCWSKKDSCTVVIWWLLI